MNGNHVRNQGSVLCFQTQAFLQLYGFLLTNDSQFFIRMPCLDLLPPCSVFHLGVSQQSVPVFPPQTFEISFSFNNNKVKADEQIQYKDIEFFLLRKTISIEWWLRDYDSAIYIRDLNEFHGLILVAS